MYRSGYNLKKIVCITTPKVLDSSAGDGISTRKIPAFLPDSDSVEKSALEHGDLSQNKSSSSIEILVSTGALISTGALVLTASS